MNRADRVSGHHALTICLAVACSLVISLTFLPLAAARFMPNKENVPGFVEGRLVDFQRL